MGEREFERTTGSDVGTGQLDHGGANNFFQSGNNRFEVPLIDTCRPGKTWTLGEDEQFCQKRKPQSRGLFNGCV